MIIEWFLLIRGAFDGGPKKSKIKIFDQAKKNQKSKKQNFGT
jgi:hypothetical protein